MVSDQSAASEQEDWMEPTADAPDLPPLRPHSLACVRLLQGVVYSDDAQTWRQILSYRSDLHDYFATIGLVLIVDENEGFAYLRQLSDAERDGEYSVLPRLLRRMPLTYEVTLLCVLLRDELRRLEDDLDNERPVVEIDSLFEIWKTLRPSAEDEVQSRKALEATMKKVEGLKFIRCFGEAGQYEIRRILKARLPIETLEQLRRELAAYAAEAGGEDHDPGDEGE